MNKDITKLEHIGDKDYSDLHLFQWPKKDRIALHDIIMNKVADMLNISQSDITSIVATGTRTYIVNNKDGIKKFHKSDSDLDVLVKINTEKYIDIHEKFNAKYPPKTWMDVIHAKPFIFNNVKISIQIMPDDYQHSRFYRWILPYVDLITLSIYGNHKYQVLDYLENFKNRIEHYEYCVLCDTFKECSHMLYYKFVSRDGNIDEGHCFSICRECYDKVINKEEYKLIDILKFFKKKKVDTVLSKINLLKRRRKKKTNKNVVKEEK